MKKKLYLYSCIEIYFNFRIYPLAIFDSFHFVNCLYVLRYNIIFFLALLSAFTRKSQSPTYRLQQQELINITTYHHCPCLTSSVIKYLDALRFLGFDVNDSDVSVVHSLWNGNVYAYQDYNFLHIRYEVFWNTAYLM